MMEKPIMRNTLYHLWKASEGGNDLDEYGITEEMAYELLRLRICNGCIIEFELDNEHLPYDVFDLLDTPCGCEYWFDKIE
jgi:hypothetical protein